MNISVQAELIWLRMLVQICREQDVLRADRMNFDTWYKQRQNASHAAYMKRTSQHLACDWRITRPSSPEEISRIYNLPLNEAES